MMKKLIWLIILALVVILGMYISSQAQKENTQQMADTQQDSQSGYVEPEHKPQEGKDPNLKVAEPLMEIPTEMPTEK